MSLKREINRQQDGASLKFALFVNLFMGPFRNCDGRRLKNDMPVILRIIMIRWSSLHYKQAMWSGLRPTAKQIQKFKMVKL